jgi:ferrous iron transport protein A
VIDRAIPLSQLLCGQSACIRRILGRPEQVHRLEEFGLRRGTRIEMFRQGNPCIIRLAGSKVCLRADDFLRILVEPALVSS